MKYDEAKKQSILFNCPTITATTRNHVGGKKQLENENEGAFPLPNFFFMFDGENVTFLECCWLGCGLCSADYTQQG